MNDGWEEYKEFRGKVFAALFVGIALVPIGILIIGTIAIAISKSLHDNINVFIPIICVGLWVFIAIVAHNEQEDIE